LKPDKRARLSKVADGHFAANHPGQDREECVLRLVQRETQRIRHFKLFAEDRRKRLDATRSLCPERVWLADFHSHSDYSDGTAVHLGEISQVASQFGIDVQTVTDHNTLDQRRDVAKFPNLACGIELVAEGQHFVVLDIKDLMCNGTGNVTLSDKLDQARKLGGFFIVAHPCGWRTCIYPPATVEKVIQLEGRYGMEIGNGAENIFDYYDYTDAQALKLWDRLLCMGRKVVAVGNTDAHAVTELGMIWNGLVGPKPDVNRIGKRAAKGNHFVSDSPFIFASVNDAAMGETIRAERCEIEVRAYDSAGLAQLRLIHNGKVINTKNDSNSPTSLTIELTHKPTASGYYRAEVLSHDFRKGFSNPLWVER